MLFLQSPQVLWRLRNGEMPSAFQPKLWWLQLGMNDLGRMQCSEEIVVLGILRVVEEIMNQRPTTKIVINSLLPMTDLRTFDVRPTDFQETFQTNTNNRRSSDVIKKVVNDNNPHRQLRFFGLGRRKRDPTILYDTHKQKKYHSITHKERKLPLWTSIQSINDQLEKFSLKHENVFYFDATEIFAELDDEDHWVLRTDMISSKGRPTLKGLEAWEDQIVESTRKLNREDEKGGE